MSTEYFKMFFRLCKKNSAYSIISTIGISILFIVYMFVFQYIKFETSYECFNENYEDIYLVSKDVFINGAFTKTSVRNPFRLASTLKAEIPEVKASSRIYPRYHITLTNLKDNKSFKEDKVFYVDTSFFDVFSLNIIKGIGKSAFKESFTTLISESFAKKMFGFEDPIGKEILMSNEDFTLSFIVKGVFQDMPKNSNLRSDILFSLLEKSWYVPYLKDGKDWLNDNYFVFVLSNPHVNIERFNEKLENVVKSHLGTYFEQFNYYEKYYLTPIKQTNLEYGNFIPRITQGKSSKILYLKIVTLILFIIAGLNYFNLTSIFLLSRIKEIYTRNVVGAGFNQLIFQLTFENILLLTFAYLIAIIFALFLVPVFNNFIQIGISYTSLLSPFIILHVFIVIIFGAFIVAILNIFYIKVVLWNNSHNLDTKSIKVGLSRKIFLILQIIMCLFIIYFLTGFYNQYRYLSNSKTGFDRENVMIIEQPTYVNQSQKGDKITWQTKNKITSFKTELQKISGVKYVSSVCVAPGCGYGATNFIRRSGEESNSTKEILMEFVDYNYFELLNIEFLSGRSFSDQFPVDRQSSMIINESAMKLLGFENPEETINQQVYMDGRQSYNIIGVVKDYNVENMRNGNSPLALTCEEYSDLIILKFANSQHKNIIPQIKEIWEKTFPGNPFNYSFLDDKLKQMYKSELDMSHLLGLITILGLFLTLLGLYTMSNLSFVRRIKEVGVRKVLGAGILNIQYILSKETLMLIIVSIVIGTPISYYFLNRWLENYANKISLDLFFLCFPILMVLVICFIVVNLIIFKTHRAKPVDILKQE